MANVLNLQADITEVPQETKRSTHGSIFWCRHSYSHSIWCC